VRRASEVGQLLEQPDTVTDVVPQHSDFGAWNILYQDDRIVLLDFHNYTVGLRAYDAAFLLAALDFKRRFRWVDPDRLRTFQQSFIETFDETDHGKAPSGRASTGTAARILRALIVMHTLYFATRLLERKRRFPIHGVTLQIPVQRFVTTWIDGLIDRVDSPNT
jgi:aminoglycoside/choline kinase family phosphotransferase